MSSESSCLKVSCKKGDLKIKILQNSLKNIRDAVFDLIKFQAKGLQLYVKELSLEFRRYFKNTYFEERQQAATSEISYKNQNSSTG